LNVKEHLEKLKLIVDKKLDRYLSSKDKHFKLIYNAMRYSVLAGGKRIRPAMVIESCKACGGSVKDAMPSACAVEMIHAYSLIHDDLPSMDNDDYRRGRPTCHKAFGEANAILAGDALLPLALNIMSKEMAPIRAVAAIGELSEAIGTNGMVGGQVLDLEFKNKKKDYKTLMFINKLKTSRLFEASAKLGAIAAGANPKEVKAMGRFGLFFGTSYQIIDDILDKDDYAKAFGVENAKRDSAELTKEAIESLDMFGRKAEGLKEMALYFLERKS
jgi:geranylgeranyl diphosphate synthase, type II